MGSLGDDRLDEAHCLSALCPHPCCWETEQRIAKGIYRKAVRKPSKCCTPFQESFPSLTVVNVSEWAGRRRLSEGNRLYKSTSLDSLEAEGSLHSFSCFPVLPQRESAQGFKSAGPASPGISLDPPASQPNGVKEKAVKLNTAQICPLIGSESPWGPGSLVLWVPNPHCVSRCFAQKRAKSPKYAVKELICLPACPVQKTSKVKEKSKGMKNKVHFHLGCSPSHSMSETGSSSLGQSFAASSASPIREERAHSKGPSTNHPSAAVQRRVGQDPDGNCNSSTFLLRNRPVVFHSVQERGVKRVSKEGPASIYKLDSKTGEKRVDWDGLRQQAYLWKKHYPSQHEECRNIVCPPGGASVSQEDYGLRPVSKVSLHLPLHSPLPLAPAAWNCMKGIWRYQQRSHPPLSQSKYLHGRASGTDTQPTVHSTSAIVSQSSLHQVLDTDEKTVRRKAITVTIAPFSSQLYSQHSNQELHDRMCERAVFPGQTGHPEESDHHANSSLTLSFITGAVEPWRDNVFIDRRPEPMGYKLSTPPPSINSI